MPDQVNRIRPIVVFISDFFFQSKIKAVADHLELDLEFRKELNRSDVVSDSRMVIVDLKLNGVDLREFLGKIRENYPKSRVIAFGPHVETELWKIARDAGVDQMMARSSFSQKLPDILQSAAS